MPVEQQIVEFMRERVYKPMTAFELAEALHIDGDDMESFIDMLTHMEDQGSIIKTRTERYGLPEKMNLATGKLQGKAKGFGFVLQDDPEQADVYVNAADLAGAMHGDRVVARIHKKQNGTRQEGVIIRILERANTRIVGTLRRQRHFAFVIPDDKRIGQEFFVAQENFQGAEDGQKVVIEIVAYAETWRAAEGRVVEVLGRPEDPGVDILAVVRKYELPEAFPEAVLEESERAPEQISEVELDGRRDLRAKRIVTIDGEDAKDLDDAVCVERLQNGNYVLGVHIADVGYYVKEGSALDQEAFQRGCSVYLVDRVIPMLPPRLSNGICSLNPQVDRLTLSCEMEWTPELRMVRHDIYPSVIRTTERMTYGNVRKILTGEEPELLERYAELVDDFRLMEEFAMKLRERRILRGAVDFDFPETKMVLDETGKPLEIKKRERSIAEQIIEEFMLAANECVAEHYHWLQAPFVYRIHENPSAEKLLAFNEFIHNFGYHLKGVGNKVHPRSLQELLEKVKGEPEERIVSTVLLRSLKQARYAAESTGHFGLAAEFYTHFTSPIRRYPDLVIHRIIREIAVGGGLSEKRHTYLSTALPDIAQHSSERERVAVDAERETEHLKKIEFMMDKLGEEFDGFVSGVTAFGMFVELDNSVEGLIHVSYLDDDYYHFHEKQYALIGERTGRTFRIGDTVRVIVDGVSKEQMTIDFRLLPAVGELPYRRTRGQRRVHETGARASANEATGTWAAEGRNGHKEKGKPGKRRESAKVAVRRENGEAGAVGARTGRKGAQSAVGKSKGQKATRNTVATSERGQAVRANNAMKDEESVGDAKTLEAGATSERGKRSRRNGTTKGAATSAAKEAQPQAAKKRGRKAAGPSRRGRDGAAGDGLSSDLLRIDAVKLWEPESREGGAESGSAESPRHGDVREFRPKSGGGKSRNRKAH